VPHYLVRAYSESEAYLRGVRSNPGDTRRIVGSLGVLCEGLRELARDPVFWDALVKHLEANPQDLDAELQERNLDAFLDAELKALTDDLEGDEDTARRLLDDLNVMVAGAGFDRHAISDVRAVTVKFRDWICAEHDTLEQAAQAKNTSWRGRFRALRVAISGTLFVAGAALVAVDAFTVVPVEPVTGVASMKGGVAAMMAAFTALRADLG
jgi:hypothetical protein